MRRDAAGSGMLFLLLLSACEKDATTDPTSSATARASATAGAEASSRPDASAKASTTTTTAASATPTPSATESAAPSATIAPPSAHALTTAPKPADGGACAGLGYCAACFDGEYPISFEHEPSKEILEGGTEPTRASQP